MTVDTDDGMKWLHMGRRDGVPIRFGALSLTPRSWSLRAVFAYGGVVLNRPVGVTVQQGSDQTYLSLRDPTRSVQLAAYGLSAALVVLGLLLPRRRARPS